MNFVPTLSFLFGVGHAYFSHIICCTNETLNINQRVTLNFYGIHKSMSLLNAIAELKFKLDIKLNISYSCNTYSKNSFIRYTRESYIRKFNSYFRV